jgi:Ca2+-binding RTX toxin-like protein
MSTIYGNANANHLVGTASDDVLYGLGGNDILDGYAGNDTLDGGTGADTMRGGRGRDIYIVDDYNDKVIENVGEGFDVVRAVWDYHLAAGASIEKLTTTNDTGSYACALVGNEFGQLIRANSAGNWLDGGGGNDRLFGMAGSDVLTGGSGVDQLTGGTGDDWFRFTDSANRDTITDFVSGLDHIDLGFIIHAEDFHFIGSAGFSHHAGQGRYANGLFELDKNGDGVADFSIASVGPIVASDIDFIASGWWDYPVYR